MKNKIILIVILICNSVTTLHAKALTSQSYDSINHSILLINDSLKELKYSFVKFEKESGHDLEKIVCNLKYATWVVDVLILMTVFFGIYHFWGFAQERKEIKNKLKEVDDKLKAIRKVEEEIKNVQQEVNAVSVGVTEIEKKIVGTQNYNNQGFENLFSFIHEYINRKGDKATIIILFLKKAIIDLYSEEENRRFTGITYVSQYGGLNEIKHLEKIIADLSENEANKKVAMEAIVQIRLRTENTI
jgi:NifB/MoaA-like Fe-S oxidoreductase